jgi:hypothetical protein
MNTTASGATFSEDRVYRYHLWRSWDATLPRCAFIGVNPSIANETKPDQTITKEVGFATRWGFGSISKVNLFGLVSTDVRGLLGVVDPVGPENDKHLYLALEGASRIVLAWGKHTPGVRKLVQARLAALGKTLFWVAQRSCEIGTLGRNDDGSPKHPLMLAYATPWIPEPTLTA